MTSYCKVKQCDDDDMDNRSNNKVKENNNNEDNNMINIKIKTTINEKILNFYINKDINIHNVKQLIYNELSLKNDENNIRLIFHGKLLSDDLKTLHNYNINNNSYIHCIINKMNIATSNPSSITTSAHPTTSSSNNNNNNNNSCCGFNISLIEDNLRTPLTIEEVNAIRSYFTSDVNEFM
jgi:hypothetical protein